MPYLTRAQPNSSSLRQPGWVRRLADPYQFHRSVWDFFHDEPNSNERSFLYRWDGPEHSRKLGTLWLLSEERPRDLPEWRMASKALEPAFAAGDRMRFSLRVNPVVRRDGKRHDVVMDAKKKLQEQQRAHQIEDRETTATIAQDAMEHWLGRRAADWGFAPVEGSLLVEGYRSLRFSKHKGGRRIQLGICDLSGLLEVEDPALFVERWFQGFGAARGFGCGLMLLKRA